MICLGSFKNARSRYKIKLEILPNIVIYIFTNIFINIINLSITETEGENNTHRDVLGLSLAPFLNLMILNFSKMTAL